MLNWQIQRLAAGVWHTGCRKASGKVSWVLVPRRQKGRWWDRTFRLVCEPLGCHAPEKPVNESVGHPRG